MAETVRNIKVTGFVRFGHVSVGETTVDTSLTFNDVDVYEPIPSSYLGFTIANLLTTDYDFLTPPHSVIQPEEENIAKITSPNKIAQLAISSLCVGAGALTVIARNDLNVAVDTIQVNQVGSGWLGSTLNYPSNLSVRSVEFIGGAALFLIDNIAIKTIVP